MPVDSDSYQCEDCPHIPDAQFEEFNLNSVGVVAFGLLVLPPSSESDVYFMKVRNEKHAELFK